MRLPFGIEISRKALPALSGVSENRGSWRSWFTIREPYTGAWQRNDEWTVETVLAYHAVYACITLIAQDVGKLRPKLVEQDSDGIWTEVKSAAFSPILRKPNPYQNHIQFKEWWTTSKLIHGNAYAFKVRDNRGIAVEAYILDPSRVKVLVAPNGDVYYRIAPDNLSGIEEEITVPASEVFHDRINCLFHPLVGTSPIYASGLAASSGLKMQDSSSSFFGKGAQPSGVITAPGSIDQATADRLSDHWNTQFVGAHAGRVAVLTAGMTWTPMRMSSVDAQLIEQMKWSAETVCSTFHVPPFKLGIGAAPTYANAAEAENNKYYSDCLQSHIESYELVWDEGLGIGEGVKTEGRTYGVELDLDGLIRMDAGAQITSLAAGVGGSVIAPNEARRKMDLKPLPGGDTVYMQQQNFSLEALNERDQDDPFAKPTPAPQADPATQREDDPDETEAAREAQAAASRARTFVAFRKHLRVEKVA